LVDLLNDLLDLKNEFSNEKEVNSYEDLKKTWNALDSDFKAKTKERNSTLEFWNHRTKLSTGNLSNKNFKTINTSLENQMELTLKDKENLIKKTQKKLFNESILGKVNFIGYIKYSREKEKKMKKNLMKNYLMIVNFIKFY
jgi:hypothetical protein